MFRIFHFILGLIVIIILSILLSHNPKNIHVRSSIQILIIEIIIGYFILNSTIGLNIVKKLSNFFNILLQFASEGINFVFEGLYTQGLAKFFLSVLCPIIFISSLIGVLQYTHILSLCIQIIGTILSKISGIGKLESFNTISSLILGQSENFIIYKDIIKNIPEQKMFNMATTAMSTVSLSVVSAYMTMLPPKYVVVALILNVFSTFFILSLLNPQIINQEKDVYLPYFYINNRNFFEIISEYILTGLKIASIVAAMLIGFIALISASNTIIKIITGTSLQTILSYIFIPFAWIIGIPTSDILQVSNIMAVKLISNEFIAIINLQKISDTLSPRSIGMLSVFLVSFSNFSSIGIITGAINSLNKKQGKIISRYGFKLIYSSTLINILSATIVGLTM